ncbi:transcriptional regulator, LysR family [Colwellia chukchiensis]|uniref:Transcriptional regulator, LysR family n=1 Tax=Colwellia chukchiensis TaxID=641665 RepID=A0A1H7RWF7_9GAMM|nr:hydrogen peroxide-inducible genes activator [Colwellia chukchiensis]SEL64378.1 transcriptional regulator, LysR family [Colwellia chukchiensis]
MISLKQLHYALAVQKTLHFKKAAQACHISQSALSTAISELEQQLDCTIFERNNKQVLVTEQGALILAKAKNVKLAVDELQQVAQLHKQVFSSAMTLGVIPTIGPYLLPKVLPAVREQYPNFKLKIVEAQSQALVEQVRSGEIDAAILALPYPLDGLMHFDFWQEDFYLVCHKDVCPNISDNISSEDVAITDLMLLKDGHCLKDHALGACKLQQQQSVSDFDSTSLHTLIQMVAGRMGTTFVPHMALDQLLHNESELRAIHLNEPGPHRTIAIIIRPNYVRAQEITLLIDMFRQQLQATYTE